VRNAKVQTHQRVKCETKMYKHSAADTDSALITDWFGDDCSLREQSIPVQLHCKNIKNSRNIHKKKL